MLFYFYMFDVPFFSSWKVIGFREGSVDMVTSKHVFVKGMIVAIMTAESLLSHIFGPTVTRARSKKPCNYIDSSKGPFKAPIREKAPAEKDKAAAP